MSEKTLVVDQLKLTYEGIFDLNGLYRTFDSWIYEKGYDRYEIKNYEKVLPTGKEVELELMPWKKTTDYFKNWVRMRAQFTEVKDVEIEVEGVKRRLNQGKVRIILDGYLETDYEDYWAAKPIFFLLRIIFDRYVFKSYYKKFEKWLINDVYDIHGRITKFLNLYRYETHR